MRRETSQNKRGGRLHGQQDLRDAWVSQVWDTHIRLIFFETALRHPLFFLDTLMSQSWDARVSHNFRDAFETLMRRQRVSVLRPAMPHNFLRHPWDFETPVRLSFETPVRLSVFETSSRHLRVSEFFSVYVCVENSFRFSPTVKSLPTSLRSSRCTDIALGFSGTQ